MSLDNEHNTEVRAEKLIAQLFEQLKIPAANNSKQMPISQAVKNTGDEGGQFIFIRK
ncbi:MAG: hypothetical protein IID12_06530 [Candidatus Marinimicrobia bacterium]|nr:hypothetical protein [Candidatus Neomarinimicrobiota bacterium]